MKRLAKVAWQKPSWWLQIFVARRSSCESARRRRSPFQPSRSERRTAAAGQYTLALIARTRDPFARSTRACEQISCSICVTSISVVGRHSNVLGISPGQMGHAGTVSELHHMAPIMLLDLHRRSPCDRIRALYVSGSMYQGRRDASHPAWLLE